MTLPVHRPAAILRPRIPVFRIVIGIAALAVSIPAARAVTDDGGKHAGVQRFLDASTSVVGWVDITQVDFEGLEQFQSRVSGQTEGLSERLKPIREGLARVGVTRVYWATSLAGLTSGIQAVIIPTDQPETLALVLQGLVPESVGNVSVVDQAVLVGNAESRTALSEVSGSAPTQLLERLNELDAPHGLVAFTAPETLLPLVSVLPQILQPDTPALAELIASLAQLQTVSITGQLPPATAELHLGTTSAAAAQRLSIALNQAVQQRLRTASQALTSKAQGAAVVVTTGSIDESAKFIADLQQLRWGDARPQALNSLKQIALAMHNFHDVHGYFPPHALVDEEGNKLLSWRVLILPYLGEQTLYDAFRLDEPWDSEHNSQLIGRMPQVLQSRDVPAAGGEPFAGMTRFVAPLTASSVFGRPGPGVPIRNITDGTSNSLLVVESGREHAVVWTRPEDLIVDEAAPLESIVGSGGAGFTACLCDGSARHLPATVSPDTLRALLTIDGGELIDWNSIR